jgi:acyl-[acyl-carrier-protein]-phospholipid O-acyltransferase/long-chain-fatty-acid--[acyl-carrier-protein] ligase
MSVATLVTLAAALFILPFFLFSATAGQLADKFEKSRLIRIIKTVEIVLMIGASIGFFMNNVWWLMTVLFLMGAQSTFFGPLKYSILPDHLEDNELIGGNGLIEAGTFLAILLGTIAGGLLILVENGVTIISGGIITIAVIGLLSSLAIPKAGPAAPELKFDYNFLRQTWIILKQTRQREDVFLSILGISWFWLVGATFLSQFPTYASMILFADEEVVTLFLTVFSIGIGIGSLLCHKLLNGRIHGTYVPAGAIGMGVCTIVLYALSNYVLPGAVDGLIGFSGFLASPVNWLLLLSLLLIAIAGGIYIVPLYAIVQSRSNASERARIIAGNNVMNALFMVLSAVLTLTVYAMEFSVTELFLIIGILNFPVALLARRLVTDQQAKQRERGELF